MNSAVKSQQEPAKIELAGVCCTRAAAPVLHDVSFALGGGQVALLLGDNGAGKTTLLRTLAGLSVPSAGRLEINTESCVFLGHASGLKPSLTLGENLDFWAGIYQTEHGKLETVLETLNLTTMQNTLAHHLSAGQKRRAAFGRVLLAQAPIWLLDEPLSALDKTNARLIKTLIKTHCEAGGIAVISTHHDSELTDDIGGAIKLDLVAFKPNVAADATYWGLA